MCVTLNRLLTLFCLRKLDYHVTFFFFWEGSFLLLLVVFLLPIRRGPNLYMCVGGGGVGNDKIALLHKELEEGKAATVVWRGGKRERKRKRVARFRLVSVYVRDA